jgi:WD40 repeat protein
MGVLAFLQRYSLFVCTVLLVTAPFGAFGCTGETAALEAEPAEALRMSFPDHADRVLQSSDGAFVATEQGFARGALAGSFAHSSAPPSEARVPSSADPRMRSRVGAGSIWRAPEVVLPQDGAEAIRFRDLGGNEVRVHEVGATGEGALAERAVAYRRPGGRSFWTTAPGGAEEWLHLEAGAVRAREAAAIWEVEGATVRQRGEGVELVDTGGVVRVTVTAPIGYVAGGREVAAGLSGSGGRIELWVAAGEEEEVLVDPLWVPAGSMSHKRSGHTATLLPNGQVLVAGGRDSSSEEGSLASTELYDPATSTWTPAPPMSTDRDRHTATLLPSGHVLVAGGSDDNQWPLGSAELYDPATNTWTPAASMGSARDNHTATLLPNGRVLVLSGCCSVASAELYDPATNTWTPAASIGRTNQVAMLLPDGQVLVAGGSDDAPELKSAELYDPATNTWAPAASMSTGRDEGHTATLLPNGKVLVAGGVADRSCLESAELYDPTINTWTSAAAMSTGRCGNTATLLANGQVLVVGGSGYGDEWESAELYDPATNTWTPAASTSYSHGDHTATLLPNGQVLVAGGNYSSSAELYTLDPLGSSCALPTDCESGFCADGVCCNTACNAGACDACSIATGAAADGTCAPLNGPVCDDGDSCTQTDTCQAGACVGTNPVTDGTGCDDANSCTQTDTCQSGACTGTNPVTDGTGCDDGNACTQTDTCQTGVCTGAKPLVCDAVDECHDAGTCDSKTGMCDQAAKPDGAPCSDGTCEGGVCTGDLTVVGCGCGVSGSPAAGGIWVGLGLLLTLRRRRGRGRGRGREAARCPQKVCPLSAQ